jgi:hypothetical protein
MDVLVVVHGKKKKQRKKKTIKRKKTKHYLQRFVSMEYTDFSLVQQWYAAGNEVAE